MNYDTFHKNFRCKDKAFSTSQELVKYTADHYPTVARFLEQWFDKKDFVEVKTSGSTGVPKPIQLSKTAMIESAIATGSFFDLSAGTTALLCMSAEYIAGKMMLVRALILGWHLDIVPPSSQPLKDIAKTYDFSAMIPMQVEKSLSKLHRIKKLIIGGGSISNQLLLNLQETSTKAYATYGMTETITHIAIKSINQPMEHHYTTLPNISVETDERGCLVINAPRISKEKIVTNDLVHLISNSQFKWLGRYDSIINSGGIKLIPEEIEQKLTPYISERFFIIGIPDSLLGEKVVLLVEGTKQPFLLEKIKKQGILKKYEIPKEVYFVPQFIETETKKIQRKKTLERINLLLKTD
ncbi:MAG: AMP-binding protein [Flavobacteriaceae bacterium]|nr:AMP-binding protein [Flavobacteriaceae bacterium]